MPCCQYFILNNLAKKAIIFKNIVIMSEKIDYRTAEELDLENIKSFITSQLGYEVLSL